jgi:hypothetical protein
MLKHFGLIGPIIFTTMVLIIAAVNWQGASSTIGQHVALSAATEAVFGVINTMAAMMLSFCLLAYIGPKWQLGNTFTIIAMVLSICLFSVGWFPHSNTATANIHQMSAWTVVWLVVVVTVFIMVKTWQLATRVVKTCGVVFLTTVGVMIGILLLNMTWYENNVFWLEILYFIAFFALIAALSDSKVKTLPQY